MEKKEFEDGDEAIQHAQFRKVEQARFRCKEWSVQHLNRKVCQKLKA